jgi:hypothetical protein
MMARMLFVLSVASLLFASCPHLSLAPACCPAPPSGKAVVNADQTVIIVWDAATKTQHFIRQASFRSDANDFGFLVPTPTQPDLAESGNAAFPFLRKLTEPKKIPLPYSPTSGLGCSEAPRPAPRSAVRVLSDQLVAGFHAVVLETNSAGALVGWLKEHGYAYSPEIEAWARPYLQKGWKITALRVAKNKQSQGDDVDASALRLTFKTDRPLFPYREPDQPSSAKALTDRKRLLRIYFLADARYRGELTKDVPWTGKVAWANKLNPSERTKVFDLLKLPKATVPYQCWLTEFEDNWPYKLAPADVNFFRDSNQETVIRDPIGASVPSPWPSDPMAYALVALVIFRPFLCRSHRGQKGLVSDRTWIDVDSLPREIIPR